MSRSCGPIVERDGRVGNGFDQKPSEPPWAGGRAGRRSSARSISSLLARHQLASSPDAHQRVLGPRAGIRAALGDVVLVGTGCAWERRTWPGPRSRRSLLRVAYWWVVARGRPDRRATSDANFMPRRTVSGNRTRRLRRPVPLGDGLRHDLAMVGLLEQVRAPRRRPCSTEGDGDQDRKSGLSSC